MNNRDKEKLRAFINAYNSMNDKERMEFNYKMFVIVSCTAAIMELVKKMNNKKNTGGSKNAE